MAATNLGEHAGFAAMAGMHGLVSGGRVAANWLLDGRFWFASGAPDQTVIRVFDPATKAVTDLFDTAALRSALSAIVGRALPYQGLPFESFAPLAGGAVRFRFEGHDYQYEPASHAVTRMPEPSMVDQHFGADPASRGRPGLMTRPTFFSDQGQVPEPLSPDGRRFAALKDGNIHIRSVSDGRYDGLTDDAEPLDSWDIESVRAGISSSGSIMSLTVNPWSPDSTRLYATRHDRRGIRPISRIRYHRHFDEVESAHITRSGDALVATQPYVFDVYSGARVKIAVDPVDAFILFLGWSDDGSTVFIVRFSRDLKVGEVFAADAATGSARMLLRETGATFIRIQHEVLGGRTGCTMLPGGRGFLWESERSGWKHLYHYDADGSLVRQLTEGEWPVADVLGFEASADRIYLSGAPDPARPYDVQTGKVALSGADLVWLTTEQGLHEAQFAPGFGYHIDTVQRPDLPPRSRVVGRDGELWHEFPEADVSKLVAAGWTAPREFVAKAADGITDLHGMMYLPPDFDGGKSYPVIEYIYGGPQVSMVDRRFMPMLPSTMGSLNHALPQLGYVVVVVDARGTPRRSKLFQDEVYGNWRASVTADHAAVLRNLAARHSFLDLGRVGIWGHSWGGYFTAACMFDAPDLYRAGVASAPGFDPFGMFIYEPYLGGVPGPETMAAYQAAMMYPDAGKLEGALMIAAGMNDLSVWHSAVAMSHALIEARKPHDFVPLPDQHHGYTTAFEAYFVEKLLRHFDTYVMRAG